MSRRRFDFRIVLTLSLLVASPAFAGINFLGGGLINVAPKPEFMLAGDLDNDGLTDIVVISPSSKEVDVFIASPGTPSHFAPVRALHFGNVLRNGALADLNADGRLDLVVTDASNQIVWILIGKGDGTFVAPYQITVPNSLTPTSVAVANFDDSGNADLAVADNRLGQVFLMLNDNGNPPRFSVGGTVTVGQGPDQIFSSDLNGDGKPDLLTLDLGGPRVKDVSVVLWNRVVQGFPEFASDVQYTVGAKPSQMVVADFTNDGRPDIAMINQSAAGGLGEIDVLVNQGNGVFSPPIIIPVPCPFFTGGTKCRPLTLVAGDFDGNGNVDLMVGMLDPRGTAGGVGGTISDAMQAFSGRGDGTFIPGGVFTIQRAPVSMATGAFTAPGNVDIAVADKSTLTLQAFANISEGGGGGNGDSCVLGDECLSSRCTNGVCCADQCDPNERCDVPGRAGTCIPIPTSPVACTLPNAPECMSTQFCVDSVCCDEACVGGHCNRTINGQDFSGVCIPGAPPGNPCSGDNEDCTTNFCSVNFVCCFDACLGDNQFCDPSGVCHTKGAPGAPCDDPQDSPNSPECASGVCDNLDPNVLQPICCQSQCDPTAQKCYQGNCVPFDYTPPPTPTETPSPTPRLTPAAPGQSCFFQSDCTTNFCTDQVCCTTGSCPGNQHCLPPDGMCHDAPSPTPTSSPGPTPPTPDPCGGCPQGLHCRVTSVGPVCESTSSGGGCSTSDDAPGPGNLAAMAMLPLALWLGRRWRQLGRVRARQRSLRQ
jgi:hypothetical protein